MWHRQARPEETLVPELTTRFGAFPEEAELPRAVRQQRWSSLNVPLAWAAAGARGHVTLFLSG